MLRKMTESAKPKKKKQLTLDGIVVTGPRPTVFTRDGLLDAVAKFVACDDQSLAVTNKAAFRNCLVIMRPKTTVADLPTTHTVSDYIHNQFVNHLKKVNTEIAVSNELKVRIKTVTHQTSTGCTRKDRDNE
jgi:hypothetical protein